MLYFTVLVGTSTVSKPAQYGCLRLYLFFIFVKINRSELFLKQIMIVWTIMKIATIS